MNLIFTTIWNEARQCMIVVSEFASVVGKSAKSSGKKINRALFGSNKLVTALFAGIANFSTSLLFAGSLPEGGSLTYGQGQVTQSGNEMTITQSSDKMALDWNSFNIGQGHKVTFVQPSTSSVAMNRVTGTDVSVIQGSLQANGQVFLSNPNGVLFTKVAQVNVGSLVATTLHMSNEDLASGRYRLQGKSDKSVINQGCITATSGDGKGGVALVAAKIINEGSITADRGTVALAAAHKVTLDLGGPVKVQIEEGALNALIEQGGAVRADSGTVIMSARAASNLMSSAINHTGVIEARSMVADTNGIIQLSAGTNGSIVIDGTLDVSSPSAKAGRIEITGQDITLKKNSHLIASGDLGGGIVLIGGDWQGSSSLQQAQHVVMEQGASINVSAFTKGDGGKVVLWSDIHDHASLTSVSGEIIATAGLLGGDGGKVETSGHKLVVHDAKVSTYAPKGKTGEWLLDPFDIVISNFDLNITDDGNGNFDSNDSSSNISVSTLTSALAFNHVTVSTGGAASTGGDAGNITVLADISELGTNTLTLHAANNINVDANITRDGGGNVTLIADAGGVQGFGNISINGVGSMLTINQGADTTYKGYISGDTGLIKNGSGSLTLDTGGFFSLYPNNGINDGIRNLAETETSNNFTGNININQGSLIGVNQQLQPFSTTSSFGDPSISGRTITINNGGTLVFGANDILGNDQFSPSVKLIINSGGVVTNRDIYDGQTGTFNVVGNIDFNGGTLSSTGGYDSTFRSWYLKGNLTVGNEFNSNISGGDNTAGIHISTNTFIDVGTGARLIVSSALRDFPGGSSSLSKTGTGDLILSGSNFFTGSININSGSLTIGNGGDTGGIASSSILIGSTGNLRFNLNNSFSFGGTISGAGSVSQIGSGSTTLSNSNSYNGLTRIISGQIIATNANALGSTSSDTEIDGGGLVVTGGLVVAESLRIKGSGVSSNGAVVSVNDNNTLSGSISLTGNSTISSFSGSSLNITGAINGDSLLTANGSGNYIFGLIGNSSPVAGLNITNASSVSFLNNVTSSSNITLQASGNININASLVATNSMVKLNTTGVVTQNGSGSITASSLALLGVGGNYTLNSSANNVSTFAADTGTIIYKNAGILTIGTVNPTGITATGPVSISTLTGNLTVSQNISTTDTSSSALILNAGLNSAAGTVSGGDIVFSGSPLITVGTGGRATLYSGSIVGTTALASSIGNGSLRFRYGSDETSTNFTTALGTGKYLIYRENRTINLTANDAIKVFDGIPWATDAGYTCTSCVNGDTAVTISYGGTAQGAVNLGTYSITPIATNLSALGYAIGTLTDGALTIATSLPSSVVSTPAETETNVASLGIIQKMTALKFNTFDSPKEQVWGMSPDSRLSYVNVSESDAIISRSFEKVEIRSQSKTDKSNTSVSDKKENIPTDDSWSKLSGIIPIRVVKGGIKQPELEEDFQEVRRYGNGR
jgi:filamentous hemagglutinin family protein